MTGEALREIFEAILPTDAIEYFAAQLGVVERRRRLDVAALVRAAVVATSSPSGGLQADVIRNYAESGAPRLARSAMYGKFDEEFEALMQVLAENALEYAQNQKLDLPGILAGVKDWRIVDSTTVKVHDAVKGELPGTGDYAAIKVHKVLSVGSGAPVEFHFSAAREHDSKHLDIDESWRGFGLLADLGYATCSIKALLHASLVSSILTSLIVHRHTLETKPKRVAAARTVPPIHPGLVAKCLVQWAYRFGVASNLEGVAATQEWARLADNLTYPSTAR